MSAHTRRSPFHNAGAIRRARFRPTLHLATILVSMAALASSFDARAADFTVNSLADTDVDDQVCTLREAILSASLDLDRNGDCGADGDGWPQQDTIGFAPGLWPQGTSEVTLQLASPLPELSGHTTITTTNLAGRRYLRLVGGGNHRLMRVVRPLNERPTTILIERIRFEGGRLDAADLPAAGAALSIAAGVSVEIRDGRFEGNDAAAGEGGGAIGVVEDCPTCRPASLRVYDTSFFDNNAGGGPGGAVLVDALQNELAFELDQVLFQNNRATAGSALMYRNSVRDKLHRTLPVRLARVRVLENILDPGGPGYPHVGISLRDTSLQQLGIIVEDFAGEENSSLVDPGGHVLLADAPRNPVRLERVAIRDNSAGALLAAGLGLTLTNSLFADNNAWSNGYAPIALLPTGSAYVAGNTFLRNRVVPAAMGPADAHQFTLLNNGTDPTSALLAGNLFVRPDGVSLAEPQCLAVPGGVLAGQNNVADHAQCAVGAGSMEASPLPVAEIALPGSFHSTAVYPLEGNPALDGWPATHCVGPQGGAITSDLSGDPRPMDGDGDGTAACDAGAFETPPALASGSLFGDGFE